MQNSTNANLHRSGRGIEAYSRGKAALGMTRAGRAIGKRAELGNRYLETRTRTLRTPVFIGAWSDGAEQKDRPRLVDCGDLAIGVLKLG